MIATRKRTRNAGIRQLAEFLTSKRGVAAIEFAFIAPILLCLYFVTMEVAQAVEANKKVGRIASMIADLVTQQQTVTRNDVDAIMKIGTSIIQPYDRSVPSIFVTAIEVTDEDSPKVQVVWSRKMVNGSTSQGEAAGSATTVPDKLKIRGSFLIRVESELEYKPMITYTADQKAALGLSAAFDNISMAERYHLRPRMTSTIPCSDC